MKGEPPPALLLQLEYEPDKGKSQSRAPQATATAKAKGQSQTRLASRRARSGVDFFPHPYKRQSSGLHGVAQKGSGLRHLSVPFLQLVRRQEGDDVLSNLIPRGYEFLDHICAGHIRVCPAYLLDAIFSPFKCGLQLTLLRFGEIQVSGKSFQFVNDLGFCFSRHYYSFPSVRR